MDGPQGALGLDRAETEDVLATASLTPSLHNAQPWRFRVEADAITLLADRDRRLPRADPDDRELHLGCGAALFTLRMALHGHGIRPLITLLPDPQDPDVIAVVRRGALRPATPEEQMLLGAVARRHTNRRTFSDAPVTRPEQQVLHRAAQAEGSWLYVVGDPAERTQLRDMAVTAHRLQTADPAFRAEIERWTAVDATRREGVPATAGGPLPPPTTGWLHRDFTGGAARTTDDHESEPLLTVLTCHLSGVRGEIQAGQALQRVLLTATAHGLAASFLSQIVEVERTRTRLRGLIRSPQPPQAVLRIGHGYPVSATPRRAVADLIDQSRTPTR